MAATCPHCNASVASLIVTAVKAKDPQGGIWKSATFACPKCNKVVGTGFDAVAQTEAIAKQVAMELANVSSHIVAGVTSHMTAEINKLRTEIARLKRTP